MLMHGNSFFYCHLAMQRGAQDYQGLLNLSADEIRGHIASLMKACYLIIRWDYNTNPILQFYETGKEKERNEALRQFCFLGSFFLAYQVIGDDFPLNIDSKLVQYLCLDLRYSPNQGTEAASLGKREPFNTPRVLSLLSTCACRYFMLDKRAHDMFRSPSVE